MAEKEKASNSFINYMSNPRSFTLKNWFAQLLKQDYLPHDTIVERVSSALTTDQDIEDFGRLIGQVFESGYRRAVDDYQDEAAKMGLKINNPIIEETTSRHLFITSSYKTP